MRTLKLFLSTLLCALIVTSCKKEKSPQPPTAGNTAPTISELNYLQSIGTSGSNLDQFNFTMSGQEHGWTSATDGNFVYVGDFGNYCVKKVDLTTNTVIGWYGFQGNTWGYYTDNATAPTPLFKPFRVLYKNNTLYALSRKQGTAETIVYKFDIGGTSNVDTSRTISENSFYSATIDDNENIIVVKNDSIKKHAPNGTVTRFGGTGSADGKLNNGGYVVQVVTVSDTIIVIDAGNSRIQKFNNNGSFLSKFSIATSGDYTSLFVVNNRFYFLEDYKLSEYSSNGVKIRSYPFEGGPNSFAISQKQILILNNKVVIQDAHYDRLVIYGK